MNKYNKIVKSLFPDRVALVFAKTVLIFSLLFVGATILLPLYNAAVKYDLIDVVPLLGYYHIIDLGAEASVISRFLYLLEISTATFFFIAFVLTRKRFFLFFAILYLIIFFDDYLQIHETFGLFLDKNFTLSNIFGLRGQDIGELLAWLIMAICIIPLGITSFRKLNRAEIIYCYAVGSSFAMLLFCAVLLDMIHILVDRDGMMWHSIGILEDGGELVAISLPLGLAFSAARQGKVN